MSNSSTKQEERIQQQRNRLFKGFGGDGEILKCSLIERFTVCRRTGCHCLEGKKHGPYLYVSYFDGKQSRQVYVPQAMEPQVRDWVKNYQKLSETVGKLSGLSVDLIRLQQQKGNIKSSKTKKKVK